MVIANHPTHQTDSNHIKVLGYLAKYEYREQPHYPLHGLEIGEKKSCERKGE